MEEPGGGWKGERVAVRVEVEEFPLKAAPIPPCRLQSIAITRGSDVGSFVLFIGTESGHLLRYQLSSLASTAQTSSPPPPLPQSSPLTASPGGSPNASGTFTNDRTNVSPGDILQQLPNLPAAAGSDSSSALVKLPGRERNGVSSPHLHPHPLIRQSQQSHSRLPDHDNGGAQTSHPADAFTNLPSSSPLPSASSVADQKVGGGKPGTGLVLTHSKHVSRSPIEALCPLPECGRIAILSDAHIALLDLNSLNIRHRLPETKGTVTMSRGLDSSLPIPYPSSFMLLEGPPDRGSRALATRNESMNKLFARGRLTSKLGGLVGGLDKAFSPGRGDVESRRKDGAERNSTATTRGSLGRQAGGTGKGLSRLAVALKKKIILFEIRPSETDNSEEGEGLMARREQSNGFHCMKVRDVSGIEGVVTMAWLGDVIIAGTRQEYLLFSLTSGLPTHLFSLPQEVPWQPLLKAFPKNREALLLIDNAGIPINTEGHPAGGSLLFQMLPDGIGSSPPYVLVAKQGVVEVYHHRTGSKLQSFALTDGGKGRSLVADDEDGTFIVVANSFKVWCLRQVPLDEQLKELLKRKEFTDAERLAEEAQPEGDGDSTKTRLAMVHAEAGFLHLFDLQFVEAMEQFLLSDIMEPSELFPFFPSLTSRWRAMVPPKRYWGLHPPPQAMRMVIESGLLAIQSGLLKAPVLVANGSTVGDIFVGLKSGKDAMVERYLIHAMENVARYLHIIREKRQLKMLEKEGVDTLLVKLYTELQATSDLNELAASSNQCVLEEVEGLLKGAGQLHALALLYESKGLWNSALRVWQTLAHMPGSPTRLPYGDVSGEPEQWLATKQEVAVNEAVRLLEQSSDTDLVLQHIHWIMKLDQNLALSILTSSKRPEPLSPEDTLLALDSDGGMVQQRYLLWLVEEQGLGDSFYHTELALSLAKSAVSSLERSSRIVEESDGSSTAPLAKDDASQSSSEPKQLVDSATKSIRKNPRDVLLTFLETSDGYDAKMVLDVIKDSQLWKEQFVLHRKLGDEISALRTLALKLEDSGAAERYCAEIGRPDAYLELMEMYLHPGEGREPMHRAAVRLLHCHGASLDPLQVLEALSLEMPLGSASETIAQLMVARVHRRRQGQIVRQLVRKENLEARIARVEERSRNVSIRPDSTCGSCGARIGTKLFALYPDDSVFCYKCLRRFGENARPASQHRSDKGSRPAVDSSL